MLPKSSFFLRKAVKKKQKKFNFIPYGAFFNRRAHTFFGLRSIFSQIFG